MVFYYPQAFLSKKCAMLSYHGFQWDLGQFCRMVSDVWNSSWMGGKETGGLVANEDLELLRICIVFLFVPIQRGVWAHWAELHAILCRQRWKPGFKALQRVALNQLWMCVQGPSACHHHSLHKLLSAGFSDREGNIPPSELMWIRNTLSSLWWRCLPCGDDVPKCTCNEDSHITGHHSSHTLIPLRNCSASKRTKLAINHMRIACNWGIWLHAPRPEQF